MCWTARIKFRSATYLSFKKCCMQLPLKENGLEVSFFSSKEEQGLHETVVVIPNLASEQFAYRVGRTLQDTVLMCGIERSWGVDIGRDTPSLWLSPEITARIGGEFRRSVHGLDVYKDHGNIWTAEAGNAHLGVSENEEYFKNTLHKNLLLEPLEADVRSALELVNESIRSNSDTALVLCVTAIEILSRQQKLPDIYSQSVDKVLTTVRCMSNLDDEVRQHILNGLGRLKRETLTQACQRTIKDLIDDETADVFRCVYEARSRLVHNDVGRGETREFAEQARDIAKSLVRARITPVC